MDPVTLAQFWGGLIVAIGCIVAVMIWFGRVVDRLSGDKNTPTIPTRLQSIEARLENTHRTAIGTKAQVETMRAQMDRLSAKMEDLLRDKAAQDAAERIAAHQNRQGVTVNTAAPGMQFQGNATIEGPAIGGDVRRLEPPGKHEQRRPFDI